MPTRHDVTSVPLQGGYVAKQCPVRAQNDAIVPGEPLPPSSFQERLFKGGNDFEAEVFAELISLHPDAVVIGAEVHGPESEAATLAAMQGEAALILGGRLPADEVGRRLGKPDILVRARSGGYRVVDVKGHMNLEPARGTASEFPGLCSPLRTPAYEVAAVDADFAAKKKESDLLQLAHYQRMLEAHGLGATDGRWSGIIGTERRVVWYDLDAPLKRTPSTTEGTKVRSTMERYDFEFNFRLDIIAVAEQHRADPSIPLLTVPVKIGECESCPWWGHCGPILDAAPGDISLLPRVGWKEWKFHHDRGVTNRAELAALDLTHDAERYAGMSQVALHEQIDQARAAVGADPAYRRRGIDSLTVPRADVEVDIDMENVETGCYLWGCLVTDRSAAGDASSKYRPFATWAPMTPDVEAANSLQFWRWLMSMRSQVTSGGRTFRAYCWNAGAENTYLRRLGLANGLADEVEGFIASESWVDLLDVWNRQIITGHGSGLKVIAPIAGFHWGVEDAGGGESMIRYDLAAAGDDAAQEWLLRYNRGDVEATLAVREWMATAALQGIGDCVAPVA